MTLCLRLIVILLLLVAGHEASAQAPPPEDAPVAVEEARPGPPPPLPDLSDPNTRDAEPLNGPRPDSNIPKALRSSGSKAGGPANDFNPSGRTEAPVAPRGDLGAVVEGRALFHGNYCGAGSRGVGLEPTDALDAACMRHDACYDAAGYRSCACDAALEREAATVSESPEAAPEIRRRALSVAEAAVAMNCRTP